MATSYGLDGNVENIIMNEEDYKEIVDSERELIPDRIRFLRECTLSAEVNQKLWLLVLGLIETWDMIK